MRQEKTPWRVSTGVRWAYRSDAIQSFLNTGFLSAVQVELSFMIGCLHPVTKAARFRGHNQADNLGTGAATIWAYQLVAGEDGRPVELGRGAMGVTYKAFDVDLHSPVTLKVINERYLGDESARLRFLREARSAASVRHPNVASVLHLGRTGSSYFYAMEFVEGETVENLIRRSGGLEVKLALEIVTQVVEGLVAVHNTDFLNTK
jgi:hypothetical protein